MRANLVRSLSSVERPFLHLLFAAPVTRNFSGIAPPCLRVPNRCCDLLAPSFRNQLVVRDKFLFVRAVRWLSAANQQPEDDRPILVSAKGGSLEVETHGAASRPVADVSKSSPGQRESDISPTSMDMKSPEQLPSEHFNRRSNASARVNRYMESILNSLAPLSQRLNRYTGTDYSGISALRSSIVSQEEAVKSQYIAVNEAKEAHASALAAQAASHKEVVQLLERKHSWSDTDLEHYMALVRSEHLNEQAVQVAQDGVTEAERMLEEGRIRLEKIERKQYHEEQIWSDTIRRNSTWVTFGLMGVNILLLLASLVAIEPWRRRRLVREFRSALDEKSFATHVDPRIRIDDLRNSYSAAAAEELPSLPQHAQGLLRHDLGPSVSELPSDQSVGDKNCVAGDAPSEVVKLRPIASQQSKASTLYADTWSKTFALWNAYWADLFSERRIALRRVDLTATALEGAAAGAAFMGLLFVLLRPR